VASTDDAPKSIPQVATELWELSTAYAKQETLDPLKGLGRYLSYGIGGALLLGGGIIMLLLGFLRALQTESETLTGNLSWVPYLIVALVGVLALALAAWRIIKRKGPGL
jgi:hypothetical protein